MNFIDTIISWFQKIMQFIIDFFTPLFELIMKPLVLLWNFLDGVFYFITVLFSIVVSVIKIFVAMFQFIGAIFLGFMRTIKILLVPNIPSSVAFPSKAGLGFQTVIDVFAPTGIITILPLALLAICWIGFVLKISGLLGGRVTVSGGM